MSPWDSIFPCLLFTLTFATYDLNHMNRDVRRITLATQGTMFLNLYYQNIQIQQFAHDIFVYILVSGLLVEECICTYVVSNVVSLLMLATRMYYGRCIVLWWNGERNKDVDTAILIMIITSWFRKRPILNRKICMLIAIASHFVSDTPSESLLFSRWRL